MTKVLDKALKDETSYASRMAAEALEKFKDSGIEIISNQSDFYNL